MPAWQAAGGSPDYGVSYWEQLTNSPQRRDANYVPVKAAPYGGGSNAPTINQLDLERQSKIRQYYGVDPSLGQDDAQKLTQQGWVYGQKAPSGYHYNDDGLLTKDGSVWKTIGRVAAIAAPIAATIATGGAASPWLVAAIGAGAGAANSALNGGNWKQDLIGAGLGGLGGYAGAGGFGGGAAGAAGGAANAAQTTGVDIAKQAAIKAGIGAAQGAVSGGGVGGALLGAGAGAAGAGVTGLTATAPLAARIAAQAGTSAAFGAAKNGAQGAIQGAASGAASGAGGGMGTPTTGIDWTQFLVNTALPIAGNIAGSLAAGREAGRTQTNNNTITRDTQQANNAAEYEKALEQRAGIELAQKQDTRAAQNDAYKNALRSSLLMNLQDASFNRPTGVPNIALSGGLRPSAIGPQAKQAAQLMNQKALMELMNGESYSDLPAPEKVGLTALQTPSGVDTALGVAGSVGNALNAYKNQQNQQAQTSLVQRLLQQSQADAQQGVRKLPAAGTQLPGTVMPNPTLPEDDVWAE